VVRVPCGVLKVPRVRRTCSMKCPFVIGASGLEVGSANGVHPEPQPFNEKVSTGVERLDAMLSGRHFTAAPTS